ncbi:ATP-binding cassette domain-containing protein [[Mycoplasma] anseris]|uniref:ATP-binding cassette domain-containing protein n=1 Tax=[Mycoplasma] anseris TaxID=92400 RepID=A0A2Z4ND02_9BACT|nr:ATP-binding cassette domain-containing protein [[Mycoplasma] anseris]AWX69442.1 ATP-binding cassette domain-containing protein [[Mycoplasma] anseris]
MSKNKFDDKNVILSIENLKKYFVNQGYINKAVDGVSFDVHQGEIVGLIGESGSGKTTVGRTILRLYDDFNGFVRLDGKIISGKKITNKRRKFLRKNVQMIFQDPHASLNGQQNIYSILKEPLQINGIMADKIRDIFKDWKEVKKNFKYTFQIKAMKLQLENLEEINTLAKPFFYKWNKIFNNLEFNTNLSNEDNFNSFFGYLEEKQQMESIIIDNMYSNTNELIQFYYDLQKRYREKNISPFEDAYYKNKQHLERMISYLKYSKEHVIAEEKIKELKAKKKQLIEEFKEVKRSTKNAFINFHIEFNNEAQLANIAKLASTDLDYYLYSLKNEYMNKKLKQTLDQVKKDCQYLEFDDFKEMILSLKTAIHEFYINKLEKIEYQKNLKTLLSVKIKEFSFDFSKYIEKSKANLIKHEEKLKALNAEIQANIQITKTTSINLNNEEDKKNLEEAQKQLKEAEISYEEARINFLATYKEEIKDLYEKIQSQQTLYKQLVDLQTECNKKLEETKEKYWLFLRSQIKDKKTEKEINSLISIYKSDLSIKEDTLKSFIIEKRYLNQDIKRIYLLLGVDNNWVESNLKNAEKSGEDSNKQKWGKRFHLLDYKIFEPFARFLISQLLYKTTIYKALEEVGLLKQFAYRYPHEFSGGQLQRIVIARALITEPQVIVADEPIASLDISIQAQVVNLIKELCRTKNIGLIFIAHDLSMIEYIADNVQIMHLGKIVEHGKTEAIYDKPLHPYTINLFKAIPKISNANVKFQDVSFDLDYLDEQQFPNIPTMQKVEEDHYIYGTDKQIKEWTKK